MKTQKCYPGKSRLTFVVWLRVNVEDVVILPLSIIIGRIPVHDVDVDAARFVGALSGGAF